MKKFLFLFLLLFSLNSFAQLDREHWFAPMVARANTGSEQQSIYLSTNETVPFTIQIFQGSTLIGTSTVSKGNPGKFVIPNRSQIITNEQADVFTAVNMGLYLKGDNAFFATLRFSILNHGEIVTSKGTAGLGTEFRTVMAPITAMNGILNFMTGILATEDNTQIKITDFSPTVEFSDGLQRTQFDITLNKGQSYIIDGNGNDARNWSGFIGAKISSNKPISVTNGNFNGQYATSATNSSDILMDQAVPIDKLGKEFVLMKGNGDIYSGMERAIIVATENNTTVYINDGSTPATTINAGEYYLTDLSAYQHQGSNHYNMYIKADKNVYVYQLLAGDGGSSMLATGGFNYIPPLSCYLPKRIEEIGSINENEYSSNSVPYSLTVPTKLNIITENGATVEIFRNGASLSLNASHGPFQVKGNPSWVTYSIPGISGNVSIISSRAVTAGISAGNDAVGYGGYFAGFSYTPTIVKRSGECLPDVVLEVIEGFSSYEWLMQSGLGYVPAPGDNTKYQYKPRQAGIYTVKLKQGSCEQVQTADYKFFNCTSYTNYEFDTCTLLQITPEFALSSQTYNPATIVIPTPPTKGSVSVGPDGIISYTANPNATGTDTFKFSFCGMGAISDCETVQASINLKQIEVYDAVLTSCSKTSTAVFNLRTALVTPDTTVIKSFFRDAEFTEEIIGAEIDAYESAAGWVYVKLSNTFPCFNTAQIELKIQEPPAILIETYNRNHCDEDYDGIIDGVYKVDISSITPIVLPAFTGFTVRYYSDQNKALTGAGDDITGLYSFSASGSVWLRVDSPSCPPEIAQIQLNTQIQFEINPTVEQTVCDNERNNSESINLSNYTSLFTTNTFDSVSIFDTLEKARKGQIADEIQNNQTLTASQIYYYRFKKSGYCDVIGTLNIVLKLPNISQALEDKKICEEATTTLDAGAGFDSYLWSTGETTQNITGVKIGTYWVDLLSNGCTYRQTVKISANEMPQITRVEIQERTVTVHASGGKSPYMFALDGGIFQDSNVFTAVPAGNHTIAVISADACEPIAFQFHLMQLYNVISPDGDGLNDELNYSGLLTKEEVQMQIFDRFGNLVFKGDSSNRFIWNGTVSGRKAYTGTFWYVIRWREPKASNLTEHTGWVFVKNRN